MSANIRTNILVPVYSMYGHTLSLAKAVAEGADEVSETDVELRRFAEFSDLREELEDDEAYQSVQSELDDLGIVDHDDLRWADGIIWGSPTRYGNMSAQMKKFIDSTASLWMAGELENKVTGMFTSTATIHGGQETTILASLPPFIHLGMIVVGVRYSKNPQILSTDGVGGSPYGPATVSGPDNSREPLDDEIKTARAFGRRVAAVADSCKNLE